jgi:glycerol transport system ATP-binding protein
MSLALKDVVLRVEGQTYIHPTSCRTRRRGFNILLGTTLAGKTTLMRLMAGLLKPTSGEIWFNGKNVTGVPVRERRVAMVYQQFIKRAPHGVRQHRLAAAGCRRSNAQVKERVGRIAELLQLSPLLDRRPAELSGGQQQRTALACAGEGRRSGAARRAAGQPRLQAARGPAR